MTEIIVGQRYSYTRTQFGDTKVGTVTVSSIASSGRIMAHYGKAGASFPVKASELSKVSE